MKKPKKRSFGPKRQQAMLERGIRPQRCGLISVVGLFMGLACVGGGWLALCPPEPAPTVIEPEPRRLCLIDAGHGGEDGGTVGYGVIEKNLTLDLAQQIALNLSARGERVAMTRENDVTVSLKERVDRAVQMKADLFVSVHFNNSSSSAVQGWEIYTTEPRSPHVATVLPGQSPEPLVKESRSLAESVGSALRSAAVLPERGLRQGDFAVTRETPCAAILIEGGYLSNKAEATRLRDQSTIGRLALAISDGIASWTPTSENASPVMISKRIDN